MGAGITPPAACVTNVSAGADRRASATHHCAPGYSGPLCAVCDAAADYAKTGLFCTACPPKVVNYAVVALVPFILVAIVVYISMYRTQSAGSSTIYFRLILTYVQTMGTIASLFIAKGTATFQAIFGSFSAVGSSPLQLSPIQCTLRLGYWTRFAGTLSIPLLMTASSIAVNLVAIAYGELRASQSVRGCCTAAHTRSARFFSERQWLAPTLFVLNLSYASITSTSFGVFACMARAVGGITYLKLDLYVKCYTNEHIAGMAGAAVIIALLVAGLPVYFYRVLSTPAVRARLSRPGGDETLTKQLGFLFAGYSIERALWWESLVMSRKALTVLIGSVLSDPYYQLAASTAVFVAALFATASMRPFELAEHNIAESASLIVIIATQIASLVFLRWVAVVAPCTSANPALADNVAPPGGSATCGELKRAQFQAVRLRAQRRARPLRPQLQL